MKYLILCLKGMVYGLTHVMPGLGGGVILILLGIYEQFVESIGNLFVKRDQWRKYLSFLVPLGIGMIITIVLASMLFSKLLDSYRAEMMIFFMGLLIGTIPTILHIHYDMRPSPGRIFALFCGVALVMATQLIKVDGEQTTVDANSIGGLAYYFLVAFCGGGASVTPGLDGSYILMLGGTYQPALGAVAALAHLEIRWGILLTTALGAVLGILICSKFIDIAIRRAPSVTYYVVLGLVIGSVYGLWPDQPARLAWPFLVILFLAGNILAYYAGRKQVPPKVSPAKMTD